MEAIVEWCHADSQVFSHDSQVFSHDSQVFYQVSHHSTTQFSGTFRYPPPCLYCCLVHSVTSTDSPPVQRGFAPGCSSGVFDRAVAAGYCTSVCIESIHCVFCNGSTAGYSSRYVYMCKYCYHVTYNRVNSGQ